MYKHIEPFCLTGTKDLFHVPGGKCFILPRLFKNGQTRNMDSCTTCTCNNSFITCQKETCEPLLCAKQYQVHPPDQCCPVCKVSARDKVCKVNGVIRAHGSKWKLDKCSPCTCINGEVMCVAETCQNSDKPCPPGTKV